MVKLNQSVTRFMLNNISQTLEQTKTMINAENCQNAFFRCFPLNIKEFTNGQDHLSNLENEILMKLLLANSTLFKGGLLTVKMVPLLLDLSTNNNGFKPFSGRAYPIPHIHCDTAATKLTD
jgi:hypothetical protein